LAAAGIDVLVTGRRAGPIAETTSLHPNIRGLAANVVCEDGVDEAVRVAVERHGRLDVIVNNAGVMRPGSLDEFDPLAAQEMWATNVLAPSLLTRSALPHLRATRGAVVNVSSTFGA